MTNLVKLFVTNKSNFILFWRLLFSILITDLLSLKILYLIINEITFVISFFYIFF